jgi:transketolase
MLLTRSEARIPEIRCLTTQRPLSLHLHGKARRRLLTRWLAVEKIRVLSLGCGSCLDYGLIAVRKKFPDRFVECGIAEQDMVSQAGGMALQGALPLVHSFACFLSTRPNEQIYNNATEGTKIGYVGSLAGLLASGPGLSHQCVRDIASLGGIPGLFLVERLAREVHLALEYCQLAAGSFYLRLVSVPRRFLTSFRRMTVGRGTVLIPGDELSMATPCFVA